jgi:hypothetical protein
MTKITREKATLKINDNLAMIPQMRRSENLSRRDLMKAL